MSDSILRYTSDICYCKLEYTVFYHGVLFLQLQRTLKETQGKVDVSKAEITRIKNELAPVEVLIFMTDWLGERCPGLPSKAQ